MHGLVSLLDSEHTTQVEALWQELEQACGLTGIKVTPFPHFSWLIAEDFNWDGLRRALHELAEELQPFSVRTSGVSLFSGTKPVLFLPLVRSAELSRTHAAIWDRISPFGKSLSKFYTPQAWMPHITLAYQDLDASNLSCAMERLAFRSFDWQIEIDNLALVFQIEGQVGKLDSRYELGR